MLASLLPGLRDLRTPLTVGYVWLTCLWLWFHEEIPERDESRGAVADIYELVSLIPTTASLAAITFLAYLLGSIVELDVARSQWFDVSRLNRSSWEAVADAVRNRLAGSSGAVAPEQATAIAEAWQRAAPGRATRRVTLSPNARLIRDGGDGRDEAVRIVKAGDAELEDAGDTGGPGSLATGVRSHSSLRDTVWWDFRRLILPADELQSGEYWQGSGGHGNAVEWRGRRPSVGLSNSPSAVDIAVLFAIRDELPDLSTRLLIERPAVFDRYDRLMSEASIRINIFLPSLAIVATLAVTHWTWIPGAVIPALLLYQGLLRRSRANAVLLDSVATKLIDSPTLLAVEAAQGSQVESARSRHPHLGRA